MDVYCTTCYQPWDTYYLWQDVILDAGLPYDETRQWPKLPGNQRLSDRYRKAFWAAGWEFGQSVINVIRCPCCPHGATPDPERLKIKAALEQLYGDDEDGLAAAYEDHQL